MASIEVSCDVVCEEESAGGGDVVGLDVAEEEGGGVDGVVGVEEEGVGGGPLGAAFQFPERGKK